MKVHLRKKKLATGKISLYLDIYTNGNRQYQFLKLYLEKANTIIDRDNNKQVLQLAENIRAKRQLEIQNGTYGFVPDFKKNIDYLKYFEALTQIRKESDIDFPSWLSCLKHLRLYIGKNQITISDINEKWLEGFKDYLINKSVKKNGEKLSQNSAHHYFNRVLNSLKEAQREKLIIDNPGDRVDYIKQEETKREFLNMEELQKLSSTECRYPVLKNAFLFSALTGLRWSDIQKLTWSEISYSNQTGGSISFKQKKTDKIELLPISKQAREMLGEEKGPGEKVFAGLKYSSYTNVELSRWVMKAGITKQITFHSARHTNATLLITNGVDIYTVSKLLGHSEIKTTQLYAKLVDKKKIEAVNTIPDLNF
ncbi:MAG TPA: site-specific integrase [Saprospiraceae bacterium]|nr:site-specific integrase [Saprospiraceae bacterium]